ncbi:MAG: hypothetical protein HZB12_00035 [Candidatus Yonathbacteria bacterium]|nr:hypothetical protein [Candidatus Yonathbacteria bacterium]
MNTITIPRGLIKNDDLVVLPRREYESMKARMFPIFFLKGKNAKSLDKRVSGGLTEYRKGKTETLESFLKKEYPELHKK